ncbi:hypothetical protein [Nocardioides panaciterrulae]|uniref:Uncharacterized protein n=1 Tax=Nocardioides panaciterrulae TaxID=661492 RepID=A0A7Y9J9E5_9ACTN|nr:hypothetical protein [Nocardioides panaciterrulae]NYD40522.1 hypothetical protein [Nocardioides panaciterrulae]
MRGPDVARLVLGGLCLTRPGLPLRLTGATNGKGTRAVVRILGARYLVQGAGGPWLHRRWVPEADAAVDAIHAASMLGLAAVAPGHRRAALVSAALASGFAVADLTHPESGTNDRHAS